MMLTPAVWVLRAVLLLQDAEVAEAALARVGAQAVPGAQ